MGVLLPGQPYTIQELSALTKTFTLSGYIPCAFFTLSIPDAGRMEDVLQFCQHLVLYVFTSMLIDM